MNGPWGLLVPVFQLVVLPVAAGYLVYRAIGRGTGTLAAVVVALAVAAWFAVHLEVPGK